LLLENLESLAAAYQSQLSEAIRQNTMPARVIATTVASVDGTPGLPDSVDPELANLISTISIRVPRLIERMEDLPLLSQCFLEAANRGSEKQIGSIRRDALDAIALHSWPRELDELREVIAAAHRVCKSHEILPADLPAAIHHAGQAAARAPKQVERIVLDELLATIEKEAIGRALAHAGGNKTEAAELLGMTRPRLYRRMVQLGMVDAQPDELAAPEFIEQDATEGLP
jgi:DNA-binding NtrC family response regulator